ncbi:MAG: hypothetical protein IPK96_03960 [Flammeovirgaceae bacterium]|jgi:hypothetical protein|nr:hypothetical protein [Flammeovirgaceae bacterium]
MEEFKAIEFQRTRDFSNKMNATFEFIRQNFKSLGKSILYIAGPAVLVGSLLIGSFMGEFLTLSQSMQNYSGNPEAFNDYFLSANFWLQLILMFVFLFISFIVTIATINNYLIIYDERKTNKIEVQEVWNRVRNTFWTYLGSALLFFLLLIVAYVVLLIPIFILGSISGFLIFFGVVFFVGGLFYLIFSSALTFFIQLYEKKNFIDAVIRSFRLVNNGKWWSTFGLILILQLIMGVSSYIFLIPYYIIIFTSSFHSVSTGGPMEFSDSMKIWGMVFFTLYYMAQMLLYSLPNIGIAFQYFNLVELKEARGLMNQIENLGQAPTDTHRPEEHF